MSSTNKPVLILVQSTDSPVENHLQKGIWERQRFSLAQYASRFQVYYYTCDPKSRTDLMPAGVVHKTAAITSGIFGLRHVLYYFFLIFSAFKWRRYADARLRIIGVNVPVIPLAKAISGKKEAVSYQFDWANGMKKDYSGIKPMVSGFVQSLVINSADHLICTTNWLKEISVERYRFPASKITIIPNYVNTDVFKPVMPKKKQVVFAGRLHWSKGVDTLITAFKGFSAKHHGYKLIIIGAGEEDKALKAMATGADVLFTGSITNSQVAVHFNESEIFVLPSVNMEGHPKALVEAMAAGCKCITSDVPGNNNVLIESNSTDLLFPSQDAAALERVLGVAADKSDNPQYEFAVRNYSSNICFEREFKILEQIN